MNGYMYFWVHVSIRHIGIDVIFNDFVELPRGFSLTH